MRFLVADDEELVREQICATLRDYGECDAVNSGRNAVKMFALAHAHNIHYDAIIVDIQMPDIDGFKALDVVNEREFSHGMLPARKVIITAHSSADNVHLAQSKCDALLVKPITSEQIRGVLTRLGLVRT